LSIVLVDSDLVDTATVLLERALHDLGLTADSPHAHLALLAAGHDALAVVGRLDCGHAVVVGVVDRVQQFA
jgi:hypothetical protein